MTLDLLRVVAYPSGLAVTLTATGCPAERARHETRPLTDPADSHAGAAEQTATSRKPSGSTVNQAAQDTAKALNEK
ncbi:hypothetical protein [Rhodococcus opacus]|uniref:hypothetical protein n=1 Tax=Rhodococcus opacus TaxID=37919 RepID=UPI0018E4750A